jgi:hypothetical protein
MAKRYGFTVVDATRPADEIFRELQNRIAALQSGKAPAAPARAPARRRVSRPH